MARPRRIVAAGPAARPEGACYETGRRPRYRSDGVAAVLVFWGFVRIAGEFRELEA